jgi:hypothetical protein
MAVSRMVLLLFLTAQAWDGVFTYAAVSTHGLAAEGNVLLATWMAMAGLAPALVAAKLGAACCGLLLYSRRLHVVLAGLTLLYAAYAIGPWMLIFHR